MSEHLPSIIECEAPHGLQSWIASNKASLEERLEDAGAILLRGFISAAEPELQFKRLVKEISHDALQYVYRSTPRTNVGEGVYTATEYPAGLSIPLHNENAFQRDWPMLLLFFCVQPADGGGGQTPLANTVKVTKRINKLVRTRFMAKKVMYVRNYHSDIDLPWQTVFQTESRTEVEAYCRAHDIDFEWKSPDRLTTRQVCQAFARHPRTGDLIWFNQAHLFHPSSQDARTRELLSNTFKEEDLPRNALYGDGSRIEEVELEDIREAFKCETVIFEWKARDVLLLDNMLVSHGRTPYKGKRRLLNAMCNPYSLYAAIAPTVATAN